MTFTATANGGSSPRLAWEINGTPTGDVGSVLNTSTLKDGDSISCTITIDQDSRCHTSTTAPSNKVVVHVHDYADPKIMIAVPVLDVCAGTAVSFKATAQNAPDYKQYQWQINGHSVGTNSTTFVTDQLTNGDIVSCNLSTAIPGCPIAVSVPSNTKVVTVRNAPVITFSPPQITIVSGESAQVNASVPNNTASFVWTPAGALLTPQSLTSVTVPLTHDTSFSLHVVDINGCAASKELAIKVLHKLYIPSAFTPNNDGRNDVFRIPADASVRLHELSIFDRWGNVVFKTTDIAKGWNGSYRGKDSGTGTYVYLFKGVVQDKEVVVKGTLMLLR